MRPSVAVLTLLALVLAMAGAWALWNSGSAAPAPLAGGLGTPTGGGTPAARPQLERSQMDRSGQTTVDAEDGVARQADDPAAAVADGTVVLLVRYPDGTPADGAAIRWMPNAELRERAANRRDHPTLVLDRQRPLGTTAADGTVRIPAGVDRLHVTAALGGDYGYRQLRTDREWDVARNRILLVPDSSLTVAVRHPDGRVAGDVRTTVQQARNRGWRTIARATTAANGVATFHHLQFSQQRMAARAATSTASARSWTSPCATRSPGSFRSRAANRSSWSCRQPPR